MGDLDILKDYKDFKCRNFGQLEHVTRSSAETNEAVRYPSWQWRDWKSYLGQPFKPVVAISKYQYKDDPGVVTMRITDGDTNVTKLDVRKRGIVVSFELPIGIQPAGLSRQRQEYLYKTVRPFLSPDSKDITCPQYHSD